MTAIKYNRKEMERILYDGGEVINPYWPNLSEDERKDITYKNLSTIKEKLRYKPIILNRMGSYIIEKGENVIALIEDSKMYIEEYISPLNGNIYLIGCFGYAKTSTNNDSRGQINIRKTSEPICDELNKYQVLIVPDENEIKVYPLRKDIKIVDDYYLIG